MRRKLFVPQVVQTSAMDCGPAALKALLEGHGIPVSYGRLREACQTSVDGTSISALDDLAKKLGLESEEVMVPHDQLLLEETGALPAILVVNQPNGLTHFVVVWRRHGAFVQVMDPAIGRRWISCRRLLDETTVHTQAVPARDWRAYAAEPEFLHGLRHRLRRIAEPDAIEPLIARALADPGWRGLAALDAAVRMIEPLRALPKDRAAQLLQAAVEEVLREPPEAPRAVPAAYWQVLPAPPAPDGTEQVKMRGAVLVRIRGLGQRAQELPVEVAAALVQGRSRPGLELFKLLEAGGLAAPILLVATVALVAAGTTVEAILLRGLLDVGRDLGLVQQRWAALGALLALMLGLLALEFPSLALTLRIARQLEVRLRLALLEKIPRLGDSYLRSRPTSDMAERCHNAHQLRAVPELAQRAVRAALETLATAAGIAWLDPPSLWAALAAAAVATAIPLLVQPALVERDHKLRTHVGALGQFYLDALLGLTAVRAHNAERSVRREHEALVVEWARAAKAVLRVAVTAEGVQLVLGLGTTVWLLLGYLPRAGDGSGVLLFTYWTMLLPVLGEELSAVAREVPMRRNLALRLLEPLQALEDKEPEVAQIFARAPEPQGVRIVYEGVEVRAGGHAVLQGIDLSIPAGAHVAIVGESGAGKTSLVGSLLGWHRPAEGHILVDGAPLAGHFQDELRAQTAWVDPAVQLWNRSLLENLRYGAPPESDVSLARTLELADLRKVLEALPEGLQTSLGEGGGFVSGGEGQRVRLGRALQRTRARLVVLDEPFRGLDRPRRRELLLRVRREWQGATLLCITHDVGETRSFERVLVLQGGRIVEDGSPSDLIARGGRYAALHGAWRESLALPE